MSLYKVDHHSLLHQSMPPKRQRLGKREADDDEDGDEPMGLDEEEEAGSLWQGLDDEVDPERVRKQFELEAARRRRKQIRAVPFHDWEPTAREIRYWERFDVLHAGSPEKVEEAFYRKRRALQAKLERARDAETAAQLKALETWHDSFHPSGRPEREARMNEEFDQKHGKSFAFSQGGHLHDAETGMVAKESQEYVVRLLGLSMPDEMVEIAMRYAGEHPPMDDCVDEDGDVEHMKATIDGLRNRVKDGDGFLASFVELYPPNTRMSEEEVRHIARFRGWGRADGDIFDAMEQDRPEELELIVDLIKTFNLRTKSYREVCFPTRLTYRDEETGEVIAERDVTFDQLLRMAPKMEAKEINFSGLTGEQASQFVDQLNPRSHFDLRNLQMDTDSVRRIFTRLNSNIIWLSATSVDQAAVGWLNAAVDEGFMPRKLGLSFVREGALDLSPLTRLIEPQRPMALFLDGVPESEFLDLTFYKPGTRYLGVERDAIEVLGIVLRPSPEEQPRRPEQIRLTQMALGGRAHPNTVAIYSPPDGRLHLIDESFLQWVVHDLRGSCTGVIMNDRGFALTGVQLVHALRVRGRVIPKTLHLSIVVGADRSGVVPPFENHFAEFLLRVDQLLDTWKVDLRTHFVCEDIRLHLYTPTPLNNNHEFEIMRSRPDNYAWMYIVTTPDRLDTWCDVHVTRTPLRTSLARALEVAREEF